MRLRSGVHPILTGTAGALLDERSGRWLQLSGTAAVALRLLLDSNDHAQAVETYADRFGVSPDVAEGDLAGVVRALADRDLLREPGQRNGWRLVRRWWR
ncbi:PqqD family peptide modification chaperone [Streptomyces sp. JNUCC 64]